MNNKQQLIFLVGGNILKYWRRVDVYQLIVVANKKLVKANNLLFPESYCYFL